MTEYTEREPSIFDLLTAAGCTPQSAGGGARDWSVRFLDMHGAVTEITGVSDHWGDSTYQQTRAVVDWLSNHGATPSPEAVQRVRLASAVANAGRASADAASAVRALTESVAALRADRADPWCIQVWRFGDAPPELRALSNHGGDEDWVALIPPAMAGEWIGWAESGPFGCCDVSEHPLDGGAVVRIGAHA